MTTPCGCCTPSVVAVPVDVENRAGLSAIAYRIGTFASFRRAILDELASTPELSGLRTRLSDDYSITIIELWAAVADVLTFYQERTANEGFLRTARLRDSVRRLVRLIDYQLYPGAAAITRLAFLLEPNKSTLLPRGLRVQSVPARDEKPQKFETIESITADSRFNQLSIVSRRTWRPPQVGDISGSLMPGQASVVALKRLPPGARIAAFDVPSQGAQLLTIRDRHIEGDRVRLVWAAPLTFASNAWATNPDAKRGIFEVGRAFRLFGLDAPPQYITTIPAPTTTAPQAQALVETNTPFMLVGDGSNQGAEAELYLDKKYEDLAVGALLLIVLEASTPPAPTGHPFRSFPWKGEVVVVRIKSVGTASAQRGQVHGATTRVAVTNPDGTDVDLVSIIDGEGRDDGAPRTTIYELVGEPLRLWPYELPDSLGADDVFVPGRRAAWDALEVGRIIEKNALVPGVQIAPRELERGRAVIALDSSGHVAGGRIAAVEIVSDDVSFGPYLGTRRPADLDTVRLIGLDEGQAERVTALASARITALPLSQQGAVELTLTIGAQVPQRLAFSGTSAQLDSVARLMESAIRGALPGVPGFARARVLATPDSRLLIIPGVSTDAVSVATTASDNVTAVALGLTPALATFVDGVRSAPIQNLSSPLTQGLLTVTFGVQDPFAFGLTLNTNDGATEIAAALDAELRAAMGSTDHVIAADDDRVVVFAPVPAAEAVSYLHIFITGAPPTRLGTASARLLGNVAAASHGETVRPESLGDGDASRAFQSFRLSKKPLTRVANLTSGVLESSLTLLVNGTRWQEVPTLYGRSATENVFVSRLADDQSVTIVAGDGETGARFPTGRANVVASYRQGLGIVGRVRANSLTTLLDRPNGLRAATNPAAAEGGADPEDIEHARDAAPGTVRSFGRAVSLRDFEDAALATGEVAKASVTWVWTGLQRAVHLTVASQGGVPFSPDGLNRVRHNLDRQRDPNFPLIVDNVSRVPIAVSARIEVEPDRVQADVLAAARAALLDALSFESLAFARPVHLSAIFAVLQSVPGVRSVDVDDLDFKSQDEDFRKAHGRDPAQRPQAHLLLLPARPQSGAPPLPAEQAWVEIPNEDVALTATGGLAM